MNDFTNGLNEIPLVGPLDEGLIALGHHSQRPIELAKLLSAF